MMSASRDNSPSVAQHLDYLLSNEICKPCSTLTSMCNTCKFDSQDIQSSDHYPATPEEMEYIDTTEDVTAVHCLQDLPGTDEKNETTLWNGSMTTICANSVFTRHSSSEGQTSATIISHALFWIWNRLMSCFSSVFFSPTAHHFKIYRFSLTFVANAYQHSSHTNTSRNRLEEPASPYLYIKLATIIKLFICACPPIPGTCSLHLGKDVGMAVRGQWVYVVSWVFAAATCNSTK